MTCVGCGKKSTSYEARVYFGVTGPFCDVACREAWLKREMERPSKPAAPLADEVTIGGFTPDELLAIESGLEMFVNCGSPPYIRDGARMKQVEQAGRDLLARIATLKGAT